MISSIKKFFSDIWTKIRTNVTNALALLATMLGSILSHIDALAAALGDPSLNQQVAAVLTDAKLVGKWMLTVGIITAVAKFKSLVQSPPKV